MKWEKKKSYDFDQPSEHIFFLLNFLYTLYFTNMQKAI